MPVKTFNIRSLPETFESARLAWSDVFVLAVIQGEDCMSHCCELWIDKH